MNSILLFFVKFLLIGLPETRFFILKRFLYRMAGAEIGPNVRICPSARILGNGRLEIGANTWLGPDVLILSRSRIKIGPNVDIAPRVFIGTGTHEISLETPGIAGKGMSLDIEIGDGCWLGANSTILAGIVLGEKAFIAAGAVVAKNVETKTLVGGVPAKRIRILE